MKGRSPTTFGGGPSSQTQSAGAEESRGWGEQLGIWASFLTGKSPCGATKCSDPSPCSTAKSAAPIVYRPPETVEEDMIVGQLVKSAQKLHFCFFVPDENPARCALLFAVLRTPRLYNLPIDDRWRSMQ
eukprot:1688635-Rhodomonas_salina.2